MQNQPCALEERSYIIQFQHPEKILAGMPGMSDALVAMLHNIDLVTYQTIKTHFDDNARNAAMDLLSDPAFAARVDRLPFVAGEIIVGLGDSITDDYQSWLEILRHLLALRRPQDNLTVINAGISGDSSASLISRFLDVVHAKPDWIFCFVGTNDARLHGESPSKTLLSLSETAANLNMLRHYAAKQTQAEWVWLTPATVLEDWISVDWFLGPLQLGWRNSDLAAIAELMRTLPDPVVDLQAVFGTPANPDYLLPDGLHPSLAGQKAIVTALIERLVA